jgi:hypothetical protein
MMATMVLAMALAGPDGLSLGELESRPIPELWAHVEGLRALRERDMVKHGIEGEANGFAQARAERVLIRRIGLRPYPLGGGRYLIHVPEAGRGHVGVIDVSEDE